MDNTNNSFYQLLLLFLISLSLYGKATFGYTNSKVSESKVRCMERERQALLKFKQGLVDDHDILSSWGSGEDNKECCKWWGVECSNRSGHVTVLDLHMDYSARLYDRNLRGELGHSLTELQHLRYLDLSYNSFRGSQMAEVIGSLHKLEYLNLSSASFSGEVPHQIGNLTSLHALDLGRNAGLTTNNLEWLSKLRLLRRLDLWGVYLNPTDWLQVIVNLPFLEELKLRGCWLNRPLPLPLLSTNSSSESLAILDLSFNGLTSSSTYYWLFNVSKNLVSIDLSSNAVEGPIPDALGEMVYLEDIDLAANLFEGGVPKSFKNLTHLRSLSLALNHNLSEPFPELLQKLSRGVEKSLERLSLSENQFYGPLTDLRRFSSLRELFIDDNQLNGSFLENFVLPPNLLYMDLSNNEITGNLLLRSSFESLGHPSRLEYLDLSSNHISRLPSDLRVFSFLRELYLSNNKFRGNVPESIGQLPKLEVLDLSSNLLEGIVSEIHFSGLSNLKELDLSFNSLAMNMSPDWFPTFQLDVIKLANCSMGHHFPQWLKTQNNFSELDLSYGGISDILPNWFWDLSPKLEYLNLSYNQINGKLPELSQKFHGYPRIDLSSNNFSGPIFSIPPNLTSLHLYKNMFVGSISFLCVIMGDIFSSLDLSNNLFTGNLPNCWMNMQSLVILNLGNNNFSGPLPKSLGFLHQLQTLHLRNNSFIGELPSSLKDCRELKAIDVGGNQLTGNIPTWIGAHLTSLVILCLRSNKFHGSIPQDICHLSSAQILDLSQNNITGEIPHCFHNLTALAQKNSSFTSVTIEFDAYDGSYYSGGEYVPNVWVIWKRQESEYRKTLGYLKIIDLSSNRLVGQIPEEIASLQGLISLNLSANHLTGTIIEQIGQMEMLESLDLSRNQLSGEIPSGLARLDYLSVLDLSYNNLSGKIPTGTQLQSFNASTYIGNKKLCGPPLKRCSWDALDPQPSDPEKNNDVGDEDDEFITKEFYMSIGIGFVFGLWGVFVILLKASWRNAYFRFLQNTNDWFYVMSRVYMARLKRMLNG